MPYSSTRRSGVPPTWTTSQRAGVQPRGSRPETRRTERPIRSTAASLTRPPPKRTSLSSTERVSCRPVSDRAAFAALRSSAA